MECDGTGMCWGGMMGMFWEKRWSLKWTGRGSKDNQRRHGRCKWRRRARVFVWRKRMPWVERDGEWELEKLMLEWGTSAPPFTGINPDQNWIDWQSNRYPFLRALIGSFNSRYPRSVYAKTVGSVEGALWLATQTQNIHLLFTSEQLEQKMASWFASVTSEEVMQINYDAVPENTKKATKFGLAVFQGNGLRF